jgi:hypothetical protein
MGVAKRLIAVTCTPAPQGYGHWALHLLAEKLVEQGIVESISYETVRQVPKKNGLKSWQK